MSASGTEKSTEGRFARFASVAWWDQALLRRSRVLVVGAGALGNEVIKNLALLGVGHMVIADMDVIEESNLSRSVLFRPTDAGRPKAECAARAAMGIYPGLRALARDGNVLATLGFGCFRWADVVVGALDNREARVFLNSACARTGRPWIDGGIDLLQGIARGFAPPATACYECTMNATDWELLNRRRSCALLARRAEREAGVPTTPTTAAVIAGIQAQEVVKFLHGRTEFMGRGFFFDGQEHNSYAIRYPVNPDCPWHETPAPVEAAPELTGEAPLQAAWDRAARRIGPPQALDLGRELVEALECAACGARERVLLPIERVTADRARCPKCGEMCAPRFVHSIAAGSELLNLSPGELGLPAWEIVWLRRGEETVGIEFAGDRPPELEESSR